MVLDVEGEVWSSRKHFIMIILCQFTSTNIFNRIPVLAIIQGTIGYILVLTAFQICLGIPLVYMEFIVGQFTQRDCIEVWKIHPCLSHIGYFIVIWQICVLICNHTVTSFVVHYLLITFEKPIPYYTCGQWSTLECNIFLNNFTVDQECIKKQGLYSYCDNIYVTFPEYQYLRYNLINPKYGKGLQVAWKILLASSLICLIVYASCLKRRKSFKWSTSLLIIYSLLSVMFIMLGSMRQKGIVVKCVDALGIDFKEFKQKFRLSNLILHLVNTLGVGTGLTFNLASSSSFRCPCFSNTVISVVIITVFTIFCIFTVAMMTCPYAYEYGVSLESILNSPIYLTYEKFPRLINEYDYKRVYLVVMFSCTSVLGLCTDVVFFYNLLELILKRNSKLAKYPGLTCLVGIILLFLITIPLFSYVGLNVITYYFRRYVVLIMTFIALLECIIFVVWYGVHRFSEDVHFMLGIKPSNLMKSAWIFACLFLTYAFSNELYYQMGSSSIYIVIFIVTIMFLSCCVRLLIAVCKRNFLYVVALDRTWGPKSDILQRSRAMFTAQAMTKEYMYRQYHLQAGIISRQKKSNVRIDKE